MHSSERVALLAKVLLFASLPQPELEYLAKTLKTHEFPPGTLMMREGESDEYIYILLEGEVEVLKAIGTLEERQLAIQPPGSLIGEMSLFDSHGSHTASVRAYTPTSVLEMSRQDFEKLLHRYPSLVYDIASQMSRRLDKTENATILDLRAKNIQLTLAYHELQLAQAQLVEKERLEREMDLARQIQRNILPASLPQQSDYDFGAFMEPARAVGGDFYDLIELGDQCVGIVLGDVSDKGVPAALIMSMTHTLMRVEASRDLSPIQVIRKVNQHLLQFCRGSMFVTLLYGILDCFSGNFHYVRAGHPPPILCTGKPSLPRPLDFELGQLLGMVDDPVLDEQQVILPLGGSLVIYSDGVTEATNAQDQPLGELGLVEHLAALCDSSAQETCSRVYEIVMSYTGPVPQQDDITLICIKRLAPSHS